MSYLSLILIKNNLSKRAILIKYVFFKLKFNHFCEDFYSKGLIEREQKFVEQFVVQINQFCRLL